jgi:hypothetical protein
MKDQKMNFFENKQTGEIPCRSRLRINLSKNSNYLHQ